jgi:hypothetical protein
MTHVAPYHTNATEDGHAHTHVYHVCDECQDGKRIKPENRIEGTGGKPRCKICMNLESSM